MEARLSEDKQRDIGGGCWRLWIDFLKPSLAKHQLAIDNLNFSCCSSEEVGDFGAETTASVVKGFAYKNKKNHKILQIFAFLKFSLRDHPQQTSSGLLISLQWCAIEMQRLLQKHHINGVALSQDYIS